MEKEKNIPDVIADAAVTAIRELSSRGEALSVAGIAAIIAANPEIVKIIEASKPAEKQAPAESVASSKELDTLKTELGRIQGQKIDLLRHLAEVEESVVDQAGFFRRILQFLSDALKNYGNFPFSSELETFRTALRQETDLSSIEKSFSALKDAVLKSADPSDRHKEKTGGLLERLFKKTPQGERQGQNAEIELYKEAYRDLLNELRLSLGQEYLERFRDAVRNLEMAGKYDELNSVRLATIGIIRDYITKISREREDAASFIREIGTRLIEIENHFVGTFSDSEKNGNDNRAFNDSLQNHIADISSGLDSCKTLDELKSVVASKLSVISEAIKQKSSTDDHMRAQAEKRLSYLKSGIDQMKHEIEAANIKAHNLEMELLKDSLTGAFNRRAYERRMQEEFIRFRRYKSHYSILVFDVDLFKSINDRFGHMVGDRCLQEIIKRVQPVLRDSDMVARYGGEEFVIILPETPLAGSLEVAEKIRRTVEATDFMHKGDKVVITVSVGASQVSEGDSEPASVFERADEAMYEAKKSGRNRVSSK